MSEFSEDELRNYLKVQKTIKMCENPHPITMIMVIVLIMGVIYILHVEFFKQVITGKWEDSKGEFHTIYQNKWTNNAVIDSKYHGFVKGNVVVYQREIDGANVNAMGIITSGMISWLHGDVWYCGQREVGRT